MRKGISIGLWLSLCLSLSLTVRPPAFAQEKKAQDGANQIVQQETVTWESFAKEGCAACQKAMMEPVAYNPEPTKTIEPFTISSFLMSISMIIQPGGSGAIQQLPWKRQNAFFDEAPSSDQVKTLVCMKLDVSGESYSVTGNYQLTVKFVSWPEGKIINRTEYFTGKRLSHALNAFRQWLRPDFFKDPSVLKLDYPPYDLKFSPDGRLLATVTGDIGSSAKRDLRIWETATGKLLSEKNYKGLEKVAFSKDGKALVAVTKYKKNSPIVKVLDTAAWKEIKPWKKDAPQNAALDDFVCFSSDGATLALPGDPQTVELWDWTTGVRKAVLAKFPKGGLMDLAFSPDGKWLAGAASGNSVILWDALDGHIVRSWENLPEYGKCVAFSPDGKTLAACSLNTIFLWDLDSGEKLRTWQAHGTRIFALAFSPDGRYLASSGSDGCIRLWDWSSGNERRVLAGHVTNVLELCFSPDGKKLASAGLDFAVKVWNMD